MIENHSFEQGRRMGRCAICDKKASHLVHKARKPLLYGLGEVVNDRYFVNAKGEFRRLEASS
jgi:hypothetical protein